MTTPNQAGFEDMPLGPVLKQALKEIGYHRPTPIQAAFIPKALENIDVIGQAQTGTGKTCAFTIPILEKLKPNGPTQAIVLGPTRELVQQVYEEAVKLRGKLDIGIAVVYGGQSLGKQIRQLEQGAQLVVGTPGRLLDLIHRHCLKTQNVNTVVLDEADRMLDIGFRPDIERILRKVPDDRQTMLLSATMTQPVLKLANRYMRNPINIDLSSKEMAVDTIAQRYFAVSEERRLPLLLHLLVRERPRQCLIFCRMKTTVRYLASELSRRMKGVTAMRGDMPQAMRTKVMKMFREGKVRVLVATDVVGRGIDVEGISHVINWDLPEDPEAYVHRVGRTGRMGKDGKAFSFVTPEQGPLLTSIEMFINKQIPADKIDGFVGFQPRERRKTVTAEYLSHQED